MSEMGEWINQLAMDRGFTRPGNEGPYPDPVVTTPLTAPVATTPPPVETPAPAAPASPATPPLKLWAQHLRAGGLMPQGNYDAYGQELLQGLQQFDPSAQWTFVPGWSNEGGETPGGWRLDYDVTKLPNVAGPGANNRYDHAGLTTAEDVELNNPDMVYDDPFYGKLTLRQNEKQESEPWWTYAAPLVVSALAPWAAGIAAGAGIGTAGLSSAVTSGAYGGMAGGAVGAGAGAGAGAGNWWDKYLGKVPQAARTVANAFDTPYVAPRPVPQPAPVVAPTPKAGAYNPNAFNNMGSAAKPAGSNNDSALVATQFAADPYGQS